MRKHQFQEWDRELSDCFVVGLGDVQAQIQSGIIFGPHGSALRRDYAEERPRRTDEGRPEYDPVVGTAIRMQREYDGRQPGNPSKAAQVILQLVEMDRPPLRIALGGDAVEAISSSDRKRLEELERWRSISVSTDY